MKSFVGKIKRTSLAFLAMVCAVSAAEAQTGKLYHTEYPGNRVFSTDLDGSNLSTLTANGNGLLDIEIDQEQGFIYWSAFTTNQIWRSNLDGSQADVLHNTTGSPFGIAIDPAADRMFVAHWTGSTIRCGLLSTGNFGLTTIINTPSLATDVEYDPNTRYLYYGVIGSGVWRVQMDSTGCGLADTPTLLVPNGGRVYGIALDTAGNRMWWTNPINDTISTADLSGGNVDLEFCDNQGVWLTGIDYRDDTLYFSDFNLDDSFSTPTSSCSPVSLGNSAPDSPWGIAVADFEATVTIEKSTNGQDSDTAPGQSLVPGSSVTWEYEVENTGNTLIDNPSLVDSDLGTINNLVSGDSDNDGELDPGETWIYQATGSAIVGQYMNTGTFTGSTAISSTETLTVNVSDDSHYLGIAQPVLVSFTSTTADNTYGPGAVINITANYDSALAAGSTLTVSLNNGITVTLNTTSGTTVSGTYTVGVTGSGEDIADLTVASIVSESVTGLIGGLVQNSSALPASPDNLGDSSNIVIDVTAPVLAEVTAVTSPTGDTTPDYVFSSDEAGALVVSGGCNSAVSSANSGNNTIALDSDGAGGALADGTFSGCQLTVEDAVGNISLPLPVSAFTVDSTPPALVSFSSSTADDKFGPGEVINITATYDGSIGSGSTLTVVLDNGASVVLNSVSGSTVSGNYTVGATGSGQDSADLTVASIASESVSDLLGNSQTASALPGSPNNLADSSNHVVDTTAPVLSEVTAVPTPTVNLNPLWTYSSSEAGAAVISGGCDSVSPGAVAGNNTVTLDSDGAGAPLSLGTFSGCQVVVTDTCGNVSAPMIASTFVIESSSPGGISQGLELWFKADEEAFVDNGATLATDGQSVERWADQSGNDYDALQGEANRRPGQVINTGTSNNFNPTLRFDGSADRLPILDKFYDTNSSLDQFGVYVAYKTDLSGNWAFIDFDRSEWYNIVTTGNSLFLNYRGDTAIRDNSVNVGVASDGLPHIAGYIYDNTLVDDTVIRFDGAEVLASDREPLGIALEDATTRFGIIGDGSEAGSFNSGHNNVFYEGDISEIIVYDNLSFSASDRRRIETYLALKYGVTLDGSQSFYEDSQGSSVFDLDDGGNGGTSGDFTADWQDVAGLGYDMDSTLDQRVAKSVNPTAVITVATDNDFTSPNDSNRTAIPDMSYLVWGHDGALVSGTRTTDIDLLTYSSRIEREWKFENTGISQAVNLSIPGMPALTSGNSYQLLSDSDGDFSSGATLIGTSTTGDFTGVTIPAGVSFLTVAFEYDDIDLEFSTASGGDLEQNGGNIPSLLVSGNINGGLSVSVTISSPDALPGADYIVAPTTIPAGIYDGTLATAVPIDLTIVDDGNVELDEVLTISIVAPANPAVQIVDVDSDGNVQASHLYTIEDDDFGPGGIGDRVLFWLRADRDTDSNVDGGSVFDWGDQLAPVVDGDQSVASKQPTYQDQVADEWNFNPVVRFDGIDDRIDIPDTPFINLATTPFKVVHLAFQTPADITTRQVLYEEGAHVRGINIYVENGVVKVASWNLANDGPGAPWGVTTCEVPVQGDGQYLLSMAIRGNDTLSGVIDCYINGETSTNPGTNVGILYPHSGDVGIGEINQITLFEDGSFDGVRVDNGVPYQGEIPEIIYFDDFNIDSASRNRVESYLAIKYGVTLFQGAGGQNYLDTTGQVIFDATGSHSGYANDIAGISLDSGTDLVQPKSKSINEDAIFTIGDATNHDDYEALVWGNDDGALGAWTNTATEQGYERIQRTWRFDEMGDVGTVSVEIDSTGLPALTKDEYVLIVDADGDFSAGLVAYPLTLGTGELTASGVEPAGDSYFTVAQRDITPPVLAVVSPVTPTPGINRTPQFTFSSTEAGSISVSGGCGTVSTNAVNGNTTITLDANNAGAGLADGIYATCMVTVTDDCGNISLPLAIPTFEILATPPTVKIGVDNVTIPESGGVAQFTLALSNPYAAPVTVTLAISGTASSGDYTSSSATVVIPALATSGTFSVTATNDSTDEFDETVVVDIQSVTNGTESGVQQATTTIIDDDAEPTVTLSINPGSIPENGGVATITATLSAPSEKPVTVNLDFSNSTATIGPDFSASSASITIPALASSGTATVTAIDDSDDDDGELVVVDIDSVVNGTEQGIQQVQTEIIDDDRSCNENPWLAPTPTLGTVVMSAHGQFTDSASFLPPSGSDFDTIIMGRSAADAQIRRQQAFDFFLNTYGVDWSTSTQIDPSTWISAAGDMLLIHAMTDPRYDYKMNSTSDRRLHPVNGEVFEGAYLMVVVSPAGATFHGTWGGAAGEFVERGAAAVHGEIFSTVPVLCNDGTVDPETFYMLYQSLEPTMNNPQDKVLYNDEIVTNDRYSSSAAFALSRKGLFLEPNTLDYEAQVTNIGQFYP